MRGLIPEFRIFSGLVPILFSLPAHAWPPTFGPEFTFTNPEILEVGNRNPTNAKSEINSAKLEQWRGVLVERCKQLGCEVRRTSDKHGAAHRVSFPDGWYFNISLDAAVLEVQTKPGTLEDFRARKELIQKEIFETARSIGIEPHKRAGQGHIHIDVDEAFGQDSRLLRNFFVDYSNHPELAWGALGNHLGNSPPVAALKPEQRKALIHALQEFDAHPGTHREFGDLIDRNVYTHGTVAEWGFPRHYQALRFAWNLNTIEMRGFRPQRSADEFVKELELIQGRIEHLKKVEGAIPFVNPPTHELPLKEVVTRFYGYVTESGLDWETYKTLLPPELVGIQPDTKRFPKPKLRNEAFDEVRDASGGLRERYRGVHEVYAGMSVIERRAFEAATFKESAGNRSLLPLPRLLSVEERDEIKKGVQQRARALQLLAEDVAKGNYERIEAFGLPRSIVKAALARSGETEAVKALMPEAIAFPYGPDLIRGPDGRYLVIEDNTGFVGGIGDSSYSREQLLRHQPAYRQFLEQDRGKSAVEILVEHLRKLAVPPDGELVMAVHPDMKVNNATLSSQLEKLGVRVIYGAKSELKVDAGGVFLNIDGVKRRVGLVLPKNYAIGGFATQTVPGLEEAARAGKVALGYQAGLEFLGDKEISPYVEKLIRGYLGEAPILGTPETHSLKLGQGADPALVEALTENREAYVLKQADGRGGSEVWIGKKTSSSEWRSLLKKAVKEPDSFIVQKFTPLSELEGHIVDMRPVTYVSRFGADVADHFWARALPVDGNGKVNVSIDGKVTAVFVTDPKKYPAQPELDVPAAARPGGFPGSSFCARLFEKLFRR
ncbi:MAG: circularly permuted type 2 ATP-grasp protein [Oligoflexia bacterium]|nr:circularly permuted type 2 ATP-grasp protein [Oligoflexia bacterium]